MMDNYQYVREALSYADAVGQLAEEAAELCHAALKLERVVRGTNPTPVTRVEATKDVMVEIADVMNALEVMQIYPNMDVIRCIRNQKMDRWVERLRKKAAEVQHGS